MLIDETKVKLIHHGHNIKRIRLAQNLKQAALAQMLGVSQQTISRMEKEKVIKDQRINKTANALGVPPQIIKEMEEDPVSIVFENNTFESGSIPHSVFGRIENYNSIENLKELLEQHNKLFTQVLQQMEQILKEKN